MRFFVQPGLAPRARPPVRIFLVFATLAVAGLAAQRVLAGGLSASGVEAFYLGRGGGEELSASAIWEEVHAGAFAYGFVLFMLGSLLAAGPVPPRVRAVLLGAATAATLADLFAPFAVVALHAGGAVRVVTSLVAWSALAALLAVTALGLERGGGRGRD